MSSATHSASRAIPALPGAHHSFVTSGGGRDLPRQRVFAAAGTEQEDVHACRLANPRAGYKGMNTFSAQDW